MRVAKLQSTKELLITEADYPVSDGKKVIVKISKVGICGSDLHLWKDGDDFKGLIMGHEFSGTVVDPGNSKTLTIGDRVTVNPIMPCGICENCKNGYTNLCGDEAIGCNIEYPGAFAEYVSCEPFTIRKIDDSITDAEAAMVEPTAVALHSVKKLDVNPNDKVLIAGAGIIGLLHASIAKSKGASYVAITDINQTRLDAAVKFGIVDDAFNASDENLLDVLEESSQTGFTKFFDCVGIGASINNGISALTQRGKAALIGVNFKPIGIETYPILVKEIQLVGINCYTDADFDESINLIRSKSINVEQFITDTIELEEIQETFENIDQGNSDNIKIMISL